MEIHWFSRLFVAQTMILRDEDCAIILIEITKVKEALHKLGRKFGFCLFPTLEVAPVNPVCNATPLDNVPAIPKGEACKL